MDSSTHLPQAAPLATELVDMGRRWKESGIPDLYEGCLGPHGGPVSRERARNIRAMLYPKPKLPEGRIEALEIPGPHGPVPLRVIWPHGIDAARTPMPTVVYFHGGGWVVGDLDSHHMHAVRIANETGSVVVNVDYRLAPEHRFPCAFDDCWVATQWVAANMDRLGQDATRLAVGGDSAGGNLAAAVAVRARDAGLALKAQLLLYPATDLTRLGGTPEIAYLGEDSKTVGRDPRASPLHAASLTGLAVAIIGVGPHDFLYKDNLAYAAALQAAGTEVRLRVFPSLNHGFFSYTAVSPGSLQAAQQLCAEFKTLLAA
jgi:acetyl esterase